MTEPITAAELLYDVLGEGACGYLLSPLKAIWFIKKSDYTTVEGPLDRNLVDDAFEIVAYDDTTSHHWERSYGADRGPDQEFAAASWQKSLECRMLMAGHVTSRQDGWAWLQGPAATRFAVPVEAQVGDLVTMTMREITEEDDMGNVRVASTVLTGLVANADPEKAGTQHG